MTTVTAIAGLESMVSNLNSGSTLGQTLGNDSSSQSSFASQLNSAIAQPLSPKSDTAVAVSTSSETKVQLESGKVNGPPKLEPPGSKDPPPGRRRQKQSQRLGASDAESTETLQQRDQVPDQTKVESNSDSGSGKPAGSGPSVEPSEASKGTIDSSKTAGPAQLTALLQSGPFFGLNGSSQSALPSFSQASFDGFGSRLAPPTQMGTEAIQSALNLGVSLNKVDSSVPSVLNVTVGNPSQVTGQMNLTEVNKSLSSASQVLPSEVGSDLVKLNVQVEKSASGPVQISGANSLPAKGTAKVELQQVPQPVAKAESSLLAEGPVGKSPDLSANPKTQTQTQRPSVAGSQPSAEALTQPLATKGTDGNSTDHSEVSNTTNLVAVTPTSSSAQKGQSGQSHSDLTSTNSSHSDLVVTAKSDSSGFASILQTAQTPMSQNSATLSTSATTSTSLPPVNISNGVQAAQQVADRIQLLAIARNSNTVTVQITPKDFGTITLAVKVASNVVAATITAANQSVHHDLSNHVQDMVNSLQQRGYSGATITVNHTSDSHFNQQTGQNSNQSQFGSNNNRGQSMSQGNPNQPQQFGNNLSQPVLPNTQDHSSIRTALNSFEIRA